MEGKQEQWKALTCQFSYKNKTKFVFEFMVDLQLTAETLMPMFTFYSDQ